MEDKENNDAVPPKVKLKINTPDADNEAASADNDTASADSGLGPATIKIKPIKKVAPPTPVVPEAEETLSKPRAQTIQLKDPVDTSSVKVDLKPVTKKSETSKIPLDSAVPKPITIQKAPEVKEEVAVTPPPPVQDAKSKTSRISLDSVMSSGEEPDEQVAPTSRPKTVKLKRPVIAPKVTPSVESSEEGVTPTRKKTIVTRRPSAPTTPTVDLTAEEDAAPGPSGPKLKTGMPQAGGAYIADRFANTGHVAPKADNPNWIFAVVGILACILLAVTIYVQVAQLPNSGFAWVGQVLQDQF